MTTTAPIREAIHAAIDAFFDRLATPIDSTADDDMAQMQPSPALVQDGVVVEVSRLRPWFSSRLELDRWFGALHRVLRFGDRFVHRQARLPNGLSAKQALGPGFHGRPPTRWKPASLAGFLRRRLDEGFTLRDAVLSSGCPLHRSAVKEVLRDIELARVRCREEAAA